MNPGVAKLAWIDYPGIYIRDGGQNHDFVFVRLARQAILKLTAKPRGKTLVRTISNLLLRQNNVICIERAVGGTGQEGSGWDGISLLRWFPEKIYDEQGEDWDQLDDIPPFIILGHELIHALHTLEHSDRLGRNNEDNKVIEEARTVGLGPWRNEQLSENGLRREWGLKQRTTFEGVLPQKLLLGTGYENM
jgi:hypothetical protein